MSKVSRDDIIRAAEEIVREKGARRLTLDAVAARVGLSKGGLLHHFRNKQSLLKAMLESAIAREEELSSWYRGKHGGGPLMSYIFSMFYLLKNEEHLPRAMIAAVAEDPALLESVKTKEAKIREETFKNYSDPELALLLIFSLRGLFLGCMLGIVDPDDPVYQRLQTRLMKLAADLD